MKQREAWERYWRAARCIARNGNHRSTRENSRTIFLNVAYALRDLDDAARQAFVHTIETQAKRASEFGWCSFDWYER